MKYLFIPVKIKNEILAMRWGNERTADGRVSDRTLEAALQFKTNSGLAKTLRAAAIQRGGVIYDDTGYQKGFVPDCTTEYDHINGIVRQELANGVTLEIHKENNLAIAYKEGVEIARFEDMTLNKWGKVLFSLQKLYTHLNAM